MFCVSTSLPREFTTMTTDTFRSRPGGSTPLTPPSPTRLPAQAPPARTARITGRQVALGVGIGAALAAAGSAATTVLAHTLAPGWAHTEGPAVLIVAEVYLAVIAGLIMAAGGPRDAARLLALRKPSARQVGSALAWAVAAAVAGLAVSLVFSPLTGGPAATLEAIVRDASDESRMPAATPLVWALIVIRLVALTGTAEELLFRGALYSWLRGRLSVPMVIAVTTALFALEHGYYPVLIPVVAAFGLAAGWVRHRTHSTAATIPMHVAIDLAMFLAAVWLA
jgi:membrane protease YdiL (CAAX protease family)